MQTENLAAAGIAWMASARMAVRVLGLLSTLFLARLLAPADFGLVAMATVIASGLELLTLFNFDMALVQTRNIARAHYDSAWTLNIALGAALALVLVAISGQIASFYGEPRLEVIVWILAAKYLVDSAGNPGTADFRRLLHFRPDFYLQVVPKIAGVGFTLTLAWWLRDYRALLGGMLFSSSVSCAMSYVLHPHRPRWCVAEVRALVRFSRWLLLNNFVGFLRTRSADLIIGRWLGSAALGIYAVAYEVANLPSTEMVAPINRVLFPSYVHVAGNTERLRAWFRGSLGAINLVILPVCAGMAALAEPLVHLMLGVKWVEAVPLVRLLAIAGAGVVLQATTGSVYNALGLPRQIALTGAIHAATLVPLLWYFTPTGGLHGAAWATLIHSWSLGIVVTYIIFLRSTPVTLRDVVSVCFRPVLGCIAMSACLVALNNAVGTQNGLVAHAAHLAGGTILGATVYVVVTLGAWALGGKPAGAEAMLVDRLRRSAGGSKA